MYGLYIPDQVLYPAPGAQFRLYKVVVCWQLALWGSYETAHAGSAKAIAVLCRCTSLHLVTHIGQTGHGCCILTSNQRIFYCMIHSLLSIFFIRVRVNRREESQGARPNQRLVLCGTGYRYSPRWPKRRYLAAFKTRANLCEDP